MIDKQRTDFEAWHGGRYRGLQEDIAYAAWTASRKLALEEAEQIVTRKAEGVARVNTYRGRVNALSQHVVDMLEDAAAAIRQQQEEGK